MVAVAVGSVLRWAKPNLPVERFGHRLHHRTTLALRPDGAIGPDVNFLHGAELPSANLRGRFAHRIVGGELVAHLRGDVVFACQLAQPAGLPDGVCERLLAMDVLAHPHRLGGHHRVVVVGDAHRHRVDAVAELVEHVAVVGELVVDLVDLGHAVEERGVDVAEGEDLSMPRHILHVALALAADADATDLDLFERRVAFGGLQGAGDPITDAR